MALFKIYKGPSTYLPATRHEGYVYFTTDEGCLYVDIDDATRVQVNAAGARSLIDEDDNVIEVDQLVKISDIIPVDQGGTGNANGIAPSANKLETPATIVVNLASTAQANFDGSTGVKPGVEGILPLSNGGHGANTAAGARTNLEVYSKQETDNEVSEVATVAYPVTLTTTGWVANSTGFQYEYSNTDLTCGRDGTVPPMIMCTSNQDEYSLIESADATPGTGIIFVASKKPAAAIGITVIDNK